MKPWEGIGVHSRSQKRQKQIWQLTLQEYLDQQYPGRGARPGLFPNLDHQHKIFVHQAISRGKYVPPPVLADYPDLMAGGGGFHGFRAAAFKRGDLVEHPPYYNPSLGSMPGYTAYVMAVKKDGRILIRSPGIGARIHAVDPSGLRLISKKREALPRHLFAPGVGMFHLMADGYTYKQKPGGAKLSYDELVMKYPGAAEAQLTVSYGGRRWPGDPGRAPQIGDTFTARSFPHLSLYTVKKAKRDGVLVTTPLDSHGFWIHYFSPSLFWRKYKLLYAPIAAFRRDSP